MNITFSIGERWIEALPETDKAEILYALTQFAFIEMQTTKEIEYSVKAIMGEHKKQIYLEKSPRAVEDGLITLRDYVHERLNAIIISMYRTRDLELAGTANETTE